MSVIGYITVFHCSILKDLRAPETHYRIILTGQKKTDEEEKKEIKLISQMDFSVWKYLS